MKEQLNHLFTAIYGHGPDMVVRSPGRINLIGEHTDYNKGLVLPAAINRYVYLGLGEREDDQVFLYAEKYKERLQVDLGALERSRTHWANYILGVIAQFKNKGHSVGGLNICIMGDIPDGAGLSSSAALECATAYAINALFNHQLVRKELAFIGQRAEHEYVGVNCGIMDQFSSILGKKDQAILLDCKTIAYKYVPLETPGYEILLLDTGVKHALASSAYNDRQASCQQGVAWVKEKYPQVDSLRDISLAQLGECVYEEDHAIYQKCKYVVQENLRVERAAAALKNRDVKSLGDILFTAHWALSKEYEVSCRELDFLVGFAEDSPKVAGSRMMGGGFGGCTINLVESGCAEEFAREAAALYEKEFNRELTSMQVEIVDGTEII